MPILTGKNLEKQQVIEASKLMLISARTAPKSGGVDDILLALVTGEEKDSLAKTMEEIGVERKIQNWKRDAQNVKDSDAVVLIGVKSTKSFGLNCGGCGYSSCEEFEKAEKKFGMDFKGPHCVFKLLDLGIALGSAVKTASILNLDNRVMYRVGVAAMKLKILPEADLVIGIPVSAKGKNIYFDRDFKVKTT
ncbi:hypothetical protein DRO26_02105 [Candidatus Bathyarchaeota archaeon]|mgnify:CR=1 FL=1|nr:MAG: hypothetical protein DRO26_02105 [Candidatus Bathyarchaeota archaeon]